MARIFGVWILFYPHQMAYPASFKLVLLGVLFDADLNIIFLGSDLRVQYVSTTSTRSPRQKEAADKLSIIFPLFLRIAEPTLFLDIYFLGCVLLELIKMTISRTESRSELYQAPKADLRFDSISPQPLTVQFINFESVP